MVYKRDEKGIWWQLEKSKWWQRGIGKWVLQYDNIDPFTGCTRTGTSYTGISG